MSVNLEIVNFGVGQDLMEETVLEFEDLNRLENENESKVQLEIHFIIISWVGNLFEVAEDHLQLKPRLGAEQEVNIDSAAAQLQAATDSPTLSALNIFSLS